jgi:anthranilate synthase component 2
MKKILVVDNYDSFTYNLVHLLKKVGYTDLVVKRNDQFELDEVEGFDKILLSPGPGIPSEGGKMPELVSRYALSKSILGVCLGHQCIGEQFGATLENLKSVVHGKGLNTKVLKADEGLFQGLPEEFETGRYHSWVVSKKNLPDCLEITAEDDSGYIMGLRHTSLDVRGVQFHPESVLTQVGEQMLTNWMEG